MCKKETQIFQTIKSLLHKLTTKAKETWLQPWEPSIGMFFWLLFIVDVVACLWSFMLNIITLENYATSQQWWFFGILLMAIVLPQVPINLFSFWWYRTDSPNRSVSWSDIAMHWLLLALPLRVLRMGKLACRTHLEQARQRMTRQNQADQNQADQIQTDQDPADFHDFHLAQADLSFLRLIAVYGGSAPQLAIRIYKMLKNWRISGIVWWDVWFGGLAIVALAINTGSLCRHSRMHRYDKQELSLASIILQILYRICFLASRVVALACLFNLGIPPALITCSCVFAPLCIWFIRMKTDFTENCQQELFFRFLMSCLHLFGMINVKDDRARYRYAFYYSLSFLVELSVLMAYIDRHDDMLKLCALPGVCWVVGLLCHGVEHHLFHPGGRWYMKRAPAAWERHCKECAAADREAALKERFVTANAS